MSESNFMQDHLQRYGHLYTDSALNPRKHYTLVEELPRFAIDAGIPEHYVTTSLSQYCSPNLVDWTLNIPTWRSSNSGGLTIVSSQNMIPQLSAVVGCCLRNFITAKLITVQTLAELLKEGNKPTPSVLAISNLGQSGTGHSGLPAWQVATVGGFLQERLSKSYLTLVVVESKHIVAAQYGVHIESLLFDNYEVWKA